MLTASFSYADIRLSLGEGVNLIAVNGQEVNSEKLFSGVTEINLPEGKNQILVNYTAEIKQGRDSELESTNPSVILFETKKDLTVSAPKNINTANKVKAFEKELNWNLISANGTPISFKAALLVKSGMQLSRDYER